MNESNTAKATQGSSEQWDDIWKDYSGIAMKKLFTRDTPSTIYQFWQRAYFEDFLKIIGGRTESAFLEMGSGRGTTSLYLASHGVADITLLDLSDTALMQAGKNFEHENLPVPKTVLANAEDTKLPENSYDFIYNIGVLEHFEDPGPFLKETYRLLRPGGVVFMPIVPQMPYYKSLVCRTFFNPLSIAKQAVKKMIGRQSKANDDGMVRTETGKKEYEQISTSLGFKDVKCIPYNPYWKINEDTGIVLNSIALPIYKMHYGAKKALGFRPGLKTLDAACCCYLLTASK